MPDPWRRLGGLLLSWTSITVLGGAAAYALIVIGAEQAGALPFSGLVLLPLVGLASGYLAGLLQRAVLAPFWKTQGNWALATALGWGLGLPLVVGLSAILKPATAALADSYRLTIYLAAAGLTGTIASIGQWRILQRVSEKHLWWLMANGVGWLMAWLVVLAVGVLLGEGEPLPLEMSRFPHAVLLGGLAGFTLGFEQAVAIIGLFAQSAWDRSREAVSGRHQR